MTERRELLYLSALAAQASPACVGGVVRHARSRNAGRGIRSVLVFDGWRFCQYLSGGAAALDALAQRVRTDARHADFTLLHAGPGEGAPLVGLPLVFALCYDAGLDAVAEARGNDAMHAFRRLLPRLDASTGAPLLKRVSGF